MKKILLSLMVLLSITAMAGNGSKKNAAEKKGWRLAIQAWSFNRFTLTEALDQMNEAGVKYLEMYPGQKIGGGIEGTTHFNMSKATQKQLKKLLKQKKIKLVNYGVATCNKKEDWVKLFQFAKAMGIETITSEPKFEDMQLVDELANKYKVNLAIHNHPKATRYWHPDIVLKSLKGRSKRIGACCDNGHWMRSAIDPIDGYEKMKGKIISLHFKDMNEFDNLKAHTVPFGTGKHNIKKTLIKLESIDFKGVFTIEYEYNRENPLPDIKQSVEYFNRVVAEMN
ncbi:sugar phosphate isomerase/epimerase [Prolixibacteraceae bacterium JC049]|jgi:sugar phosphate isomerase/epimerase|nr:sugar phosphate isomerase/epimerase [Prolixibacteraceae bacterium JC049]